MKKPQCSVRIEIVFLHHRMPEKYSKRKIHPNIYMYIYIYLIWGNILHVLLLTG